MTLKGDAEFKGKLTSNLKNEIRYLVSFNASGQKSGNLHFDGLLLFKTYNKDLDKKSTEELCLMTLKSDAKFEEKLTLSSKNNMRNLVSFNASTCKYENLHFDVLLFVHSI